VRVWDVPPRILCRTHLLGEHREIHAIFSVLANGKSGYARHPETLRWKGKLKALVIRHNLVANEMKRRGYNHKSPLDAPDDKSVQREKLHSVAEQMQMLYLKPCECPLEDE